MLTDTTGLAIADKTGAPRLLIGAIFAQLLIYTRTLHPDAGSSKAFLSGGYECARDRVRSRCLDCHQLPRVPNPIASIAIPDRPRRVNADVAELIIASRREHSRKADEIYERVERLAAGPYLELFGSAEAPHPEGWTHWIGKDRAAVRRWKSNSHPGVAAAS